MIFSYHNSNNVHILQLVNMSPKSHLGSFFSFFVFSSSISLLEKPNHLSSIPFHILHTADYESPWRCTLCFHVSCMWSFDLLSCLARILYRWYYALHLIYLRYMIATVSCCGVKIDKRDIKLEDDGSEKKIFLLNETKMFRVFCYRPQFTHH